MPPPDVPPTAGRLQVAVFAGMAEVAGCRTVELDWQGGTVADLRRSLAAACPELGPLLERSAVARGDVYVTDTELLAAGDDVAIIPPVSGG